MSISKKQRERGKILAKLEKKIEEDKKLIETSKLKNKRKKEPEKEYKKPKGLFDF